MSFECCKGCKPPKRNPYCHAYCPEYLAEKAISDAKREKRFAQQIVESGLAAQTLAGVDRANKKRKGWKKW